MTDPAELLPHLTAWNNGRGISLLDYLFCFAQSDMAIAYAELFWPKFVAFEEYIFRAGFEEAHVRSWQGQQDVSRKNIEAAINYIDVRSLFRKSSEEQAELVDKRCKFIRSTLAEIYQVKLLRDFPNHCFEINVESDVEDVSLTFFQL